MYPILKFMTNFGDLAILLPLVLVILYGWRRCVARAVP